MNRRQSFTTALAITSAILTTLCPLDALGDLLFVDSDGPTGGDGTSWASAFVDLQDALDVARAGDEIWVARGLYVPDRGTGDWHYSFHLIEGVRLYGGFAGDEESLEQRDVAANPTILSGDLSGDDEADFVNYEDNSFHVVQLIGLSDATVMDGFVVSGGYANGPCCQHDRGGGMVVREGSPCVSNCVFRHNSGTYGASVHCDGTRVSFSDCSFEDNQGELNAGAVFAYSGSPDFLRCSFQRQWAPSGAGAVYTIGAVIGLYDCVFEGNECGEGAGAIWAIGSASQIHNGIFRENTGGPVGALFLAGQGGKMSDCLFESNGTWPDYNGGAAMYLDRADSFEVSRCVIIEHDSSSRGTVQVSGGSVLFRECAITDNHGIEMAGGIVAMNATLVEVVDCTIANNSSDNYGGAITCLGSNLDIHRSEIVGNEGSYGGGVWVYNCNLLIEDSLFSGNSSYKGGGMYEQLSSVIEIRRSTFVGNSATYGGGVLIVSEAQIENSIFWDNTASHSGSVEYEQIDPQGEMPTLTYCVLEGLESDWGSNTNIGEDPLFIDGDGPDDLYGTADDNARLTFASPCRDGADPDYVPIDGAADLDGHGRVLCQRLDIGAYEFGIGNSNCDSVVDLDDYASFTECLTGPGASGSPGQCTPFDFDSDGDVDLLDYSGMMAVFSQP